MGNKNKKSKRDVMDIAKTLRTETVDVLGSYTGTADAPTQVMPEQDGDDL